jgi:hypothetical protein
MYYFGILIFFGSDIYTFIEAGIFIPSSNIFISKDRANTDSAPAQGKLADLNCPYCEILE